MMTDPDYVQLARLVGHYGLKAVVDSVAAIALQNVEAGTISAGVVWGHDAKVLQRAVPQLWQGGRGA